MCFSPGAICLNIVLLYGHTVHHNTLRVPSNGVVGNIASVLPSASVCRRGSKPIVHNLSMYCPRFTHTNDQGLSTCCSKHASKQAKLLYSLAQWHGRVRTVLIITVGQERSFVSGLCFYSSPWCCVRHFFLWLKIRLGVEWARITSTAYTTTLNRRDSQQFSQIVDPYLWCDERTAFHSRLAAELQY